MAAVRRLLDFSMFGGLWFVLPTDDRAEKP